MIVAISALPQPHTVIIPHNQAPQNLTAYTSQQSTADQHPIKAAWESVFPDSISFFTFMLVISTIGLWLATMRIAKDTRESGKTQADKMERSIGEAARAAEAMQGVARAMEANTAHIETSIGLQRRFGQMQLRPYLTVLVGEGARQDATHVFEVQPKIWNAGATPAKDVRWRIAVDVISLQNYSKFRFPLPKELGSEKMIVASQRDYHLSAILPYRVSDEDATRIMLGIGDKALIVWGYLSYRDGLGRRFWTTFAQQVWWVPLPDKEGEITATVMRGRFLTKHNRAN